MKINYPSHIHLIKIPQEVEFTLFLIREELKSRRLTSGLDKIGFDSTICISDFSSLIFSAIGFDTNSDEFYEWYLNQLDTFSQNIDLSDGQSLSKQAFDFYIHLRVEKRSQEVGKRIRS